MRGHVAEERAGASERVRERVCLCVCRVCGGSMSALEGREGSACMRAGAAQAHVQCVRCACSYAEEDERLNGTRDLART